MSPLLRYPGVMQVICTLGALSECVGNHQLLPSLLPLRSRTYFANKQRRPCNHTSSPVWQGFSSGSWLMRQRRLAAIWVHCKFASTLADGNFTFFDVPTGWRSNTQRRREASNIFRFENCKRTALDYIDPNQTVLG